MATYPGAFINGAWQDGKGAEFEVRNPYDDSLVGTVNAATRHLYPLKKKSCF